MSACPEVTNPAPRAEDEDGQTKARPPKKGKDNKRKPYKRPTGAHPHIPRAGFRITEWCARYNVGRSHFYELKEKKIGPKVTDVGGVHHHHAGG